MTNAPVNITLVGFDDLYKTLRTIPEQTKPVMRKTMKAGAKVVFKAARQLVPVASDADLSATSKEKGLKPGDLKAAMKVRATPKKRRGTISYSVTFGGSGLFTGNQYYGGMVEFGTKLQQPQRFIQSAFDDNVEKVIAACRTAGAAAIEKYFRTGKA